MRAAGNGIVRMLLCGAALAVAVPGAANPRHSGEAAARAHLSRHAEALGLTRAGTAPGEPSRIDHLGQSIWRFPLLVDGLPVFFHGAAVQTDAAGAVRRVSCRAPGIAADRPHPDPGGRATRDRARAAGLPVGAAEAGWLDLGSRLAPVVRAATPGAEAKMLFLAAGSGLVLHAEPLYDHREPLALVFPENPATTPSPALVRLPLLDPPFDVLYGAYARVERCLDLEDCNETAPVAGPDPRGQFLFAPDLEPHTSDDAFAEVNTYFNITKISDWARRTFGWEGLFNGEEWIRVKVGRAFHNAAFYQGSAEAEPFIVFGQDTVDFAYDADVAFHEFGHALNRSTWSHSWYFKDAFGMNTSPFGIEEGLADIWAQTLSGDPVMNSYILASRSADNDLVCPDDLRGQGHMEARILSGMGWDTRRLIGADPWEHAVYRTLALLVGEQTFDGFAEALAASLEDLADEGVAGAKPWHATALRQEAEARGLYRSDCLERLVPLPEGPRRRVYGYGRERTSGRDQPVGLQWRLVAPEGAAAFRLFLDWRYPADADPGYEVLISRGDPVAVSWRDPDLHPPGTPIFTTDADLGVTGAPLFVDFPFQGHSPLEPDEEVYVLLVADTEAPVFVVDASVWFVEHLGPGPEGSGPSGDPDATRARAGCAAAVGPRPAGLLGMLGSLRGR